MSYPRETDELQPVTVTVDGVATTAAVEFAVVPNGERPGDWTAPYVVGDKSGVRVAGLAPGLYRVFARVTDTPEVPVIDCGTLLVS